MSTGKSTKTIRCPYCGYEGKPEDFTYIYESVLYIADHEVLHEERERPPLVICPRCRRGFLLDPSYKEFPKRKIMN